MRPGRPKTIPIDPERQLEQRRAMKALREKPRVFVTFRRFGAGGMTARVLIGRDYFDVDERQLTKLEAGRTPDDLGLSPAVED